MIIGMSLMEAVDAKTEKIIQRPDTFLQDLFMAQLYFWSEEFLLCINLIRNLIHPHSQKDYQGIVPRFEHIMTKEQLKFQTHKLSTTLIIHVSESSILFGYLNVQCNDHSSVTYVSTTFSIRLVECTQRLSRPYKL